MAGLASRGSAQQATEVQVAPPNVRLRVGERAQVFATAYGQGGGVIVSAAFRWTSSDNSAVRVETDSLSPEVATVIAVGPGAATVEARVGNARGFTTVQVTAVAPVTPAPVPQAPVAVAPPLPDSVLPMTTRTSALRTVVRIDAQRFGMAPSCATGVLVGRGLVATSYQAVRGADRVTVTPEGGAGVGTGVQVASYSVAGDVAILRVPIERTDTASLVRDVIDNQYVWIVGPFDCQSPASTERTRITSWDNRPVGSLQLENVVREAEQGAPVIDRSGALVGIVSGDRSVAAPFSKVETALGDARGNVVAQRLQTVDEVGRAESHLYGSIIARADLPGATIRVTPLETWHWTGLGIDGTSPLTFSGPEGRYRLDLVSGGTTRATSVVRITPGSSAQVTLSPPPEAVAAQPTPVPPSAPIPTQPVARKGGGGKVVPIVLLLAVGGGAGVFLATKKKTPEPPGAQQGSITISVPNP